MSSYHALWWDKNPSFDLKTIKFMDGSKGAVSINSSLNFCHEIINKIKSNFSEYVDTEQYNNIISKLEKTAKDE
jgi:hypothetical protein